MIDAADLAKRFAYHKPSRPEVASNHEAVRGLLLEAALEISVRTPEGREQSLALTKLEEAMMWANAAIARNQFGDETEKLRQAMPDATEQLKRALLPEVGPPRSDAEVAEALARYHAGKEIEGDIEKLC